MADNITIPATGSGTATPNVATDDVGGVHFQRIKVNYGSEGAAQDVDATHGLPVNVISGSVGNAAAGNTGSGVPSQADYTGVNVGGTLRGQTGVNPSGTVYAGQADIASIAGTTADTNSGNKSAGTLRMVIATDQPQLTNALKVDGSAVTQPVSIAATVTGAVAGTVAHAASDSGNPIKVGYKAISVGSSPTAVSNAQRTDAYANLHGIPFVIAGHPNTVTVRATYTSVQTDIAIVTQGAGGKIIVTEITVALSNDMASSPLVRIGFGTANTPTTTGVVFSHPGMFAGQDSHRGNGSGILGIGADNEDLRITTGTITTGTVDVVVSYHVVPS